MQISADFAERVVVRPGDRAWTASPLPGVERLMLDRVGGEVARATSLVRYAPDSRFDAHVHELGEEILVLDGVFSDASGDHGPGAYLRNPPGSAHAPWSAPGCLLFVKLRQFAPDDQATVRIDTRAAPFLPGIARGLSVLPLHAHGPESVALVRWAPGTVFNPHVHPGGEEIVVLEGEFADDQGRYPTGSWIRSPAWSRHHPFSETGCLIYVKTGHLPAEG